MNKKIVMTLVMLISVTTFAQDSVVESVVAVVPGVSVEPAKKIIKSEVAEAVEIVIEKEPEVIKESTPQESLSDIDFNEEDFDEEAVMQELEALLSQMQVSTETK